MGKKSVDATKLIAVLSMGVEQGNEVNVTVEGDDEDTAVVELEKFF